MEGGRDKGKRKVMEGKRSEEDENHGDRKQEINYRAWRKAVKER